MGSMQEQPRLDEQAVLSTQVSTERVVREEQARQVHYAHLFCAILSPPLDIQTAEQRRQEEKTAVEQKLAQVETNFKRAAFIFQALDQVGITYSLTRHLNSVLLANAHRLYMPALVRDLDIHDIDIMIEFNPAKIADLQQELSAALPEGVTLELVHDTQSVPPHPDGFQSAFFSSYLLKGTDEQGQPWELEIELFADFSKVGREKPYVTLSDPADKANIIRVPFRGATYPCYAGSGIQDSYRDQYQLVMKRLLQANRSDTASMNKLFAAAEKAKTREANLATILDVHQRLSPFLSPKSSQ
jgi:hypothetical protein